MQPVVVTLYRVRETALWAEVVGVAKTFGRDVRAVEEVGVVHGAVGGEGAVIAVGDVVYVDAVVLFWFAAAGEEAVDVVAHDAGSRIAGGIGVVRMAERMFAELTVRVDGDRWTDGKLLRG